MLNKSYQYYPTGCRTLLADNQTKSDVMPDATLSALWRSLSNDRSLADTFEFKDQVIVQVKNLFGDFGVWLDEQDNNAKLTNHTYELLKDTIEYINTGRRSIMIISRVAIVKQQYLDGIYVDENVALRKTRLRELLLVKPSEFVQHWLKHRDGFDDMLCTSNFLFGTELRK